MRDVNSNTEALKKNFLELTELKHILRKTQTFFDEVGRYTVVIGYKNKTLPRLCSLMPDAY